MVGAVGLSHETACVFLVRLADGAIHMQVLDGGAVDEAERSAVVIVAVVGVVEGDGVAVAVEGALETCVLAKAQHGDGHIGIDSLIQCDVVHQYVMLAPGFSHNDVHVKTAPVGGAGNLVGAGFRAVARVGIKVIVLRHVG